MEDFVSGPRELLLKLVEENYPLPRKPDSFQQGLLWLFQHVNLTKLTIILQFSLVVICKYCVILGT